VNTIMNLRVPQKAETSASEEGIYSTSYANQRKWQAEAVLLPAQGIVQPFSLFSPTNRKQPERMILALNFRQTTCSLFT
jgi:hypothetical protein